MFLSSNFQASKPLELIFGDICEPLTPLKLGSNMYLFFVVDDFSRFMWVSLLKYKSDAFNAFKKFKELAAVEKGVKLKSF